MADNSDGFECDCEGTLYEGKLCERGLVLIDSVGVLKVDKPKGIIVRAKPDKDTSYIFDPCYGPNDNESYYIVPCNFTLSNTITSRLIIFVGKKAGSYSVNLLASTTYTVPIIVSDNKVSPYFSSPFFDDVQSSCCEGRTLPICHELDSVKLKSSCSWNITPQQQVTSGIVFIEYDENKLKVPLSLSGLQIITSGTIATTLPPRNGSVPCKPCELTPLGSLNAFSGRCYEHIPGPADLNAFVVNQSLTDSFFKSVRPSLFPAWLNIDITKDNQALLKLSSTDYLAKLVSSDALLTERGCQSLVIESSQGQYILLQHNGPLNLTIQNEQSSRLESPSQSDYYCIAVHVCSGQSSPLHIGLPPSAQDGIKSIAFISNYINKGWEFNFKSVILRKTLYSFYLHEKIWNGFVYAEDFSRADIHYDTLVNMEASGKYSYSMTSIDLDFNGFVRYKYVTKSTEV